MKKIMYVIGGVVLLIIIIGIIKFNFINDDVYTPDGNGNYVNNQGKKAEFVKGDSDKNNIKSEEGKMKTRAGKMTGTSVERVAKDGVDTGEVKVSIASPDEKEFYSGDSRLWEAKVEGFDRSGNKDYQCYWTWYVNEEKKWHNLKGCKSTRAVPFNPGNMKVEVRVEFTQTDYSSGKKEVKVLDAKTVTRDYTLLSK